MRPAFWEAVGACIRALAIMSRSHSGCGIQQDLAAFVKLMHIDMNCSDDVEILLRMQAQKNGMIPRLIHQIVGFRIFEVPNIFYMNCKNKHLRSKNK